MKVKNDEIPSKAYLEFVSIDIYNNKDINDCFEEVIGPLERLRKVVLENWMSSMESNKFEI